jgi:hypothetical protein
VRPASTPWAQVYLCVGMTTMATLLLELSLTRIFSVVFYYHFAFLAISIALFGLGAGGVFSYIVAGWKTPLYTKLGRISAANAVLVILAVTVILAQKKDISNWDLALVYFTTALPFFGAGAVVSLAISETMERVDRVYFVDLAGAALGCLLLVPLLNWLQGPGAIIAVAVMFATAAAIWHSIGGAVVGRIFSVALALALVAFLIFNHANKLIDVKYAKGKKLQQETFVKWNSFSRIGLGTDENGMGMIYIDADASTGIANFDFARLTPIEKHYLLEQGPALPYAVRPGARTLIIGPGGGWDVARALASGSGDVTGVEINRIIAETIMREKFPDKSRGLYLRPDVHIFVEDGRAFVRRSTDRYQVIQATLVDTWASTAAGAFALSENNLYTTEALADYLSHLTPDGLVAFTRWGFEPPRESLRLVSLAMEALASMGEGEAWRHVIVGREGSVQGWGASDTVLISRKPFSDADIARARAHFAVSEMREVYAPGEPEKNQFGEMLRSPNPDRYQRAYPFDITPVNDNRPFFFYTVQPRDLWAFLRTASHDTADYKVNKAVPLLFGVMAVSLLATVLILLLPPFVLGTRLPRQPGVLGFLSYFLFIGAGYILIEVGLIQRFVLFLGHPTYALTVVIFTMLIASGAGSFTSARLVGMHEGKLIKSLGLIAVLAALLALSTSVLLPALVGLPLAAKIAIAVLMIGPLGFVMGLPFPTGLKRLEVWHAPSVRWAWSLNAASSVLGSACALVCSIYLGLVQTLMAGGLLYLAALAVVARVHPVTPAAEAGPGRVLLAR